jgi:hypothetical protein
METNLKIDAQTLEQCLKSICHVGSTEYVNICTGVHSTVAWGAGDWIAVSLGVAFIGGIALMIGALIFKIAFD